MDRIQSAMKEHKACKRFRRANAARFMRHVKRDKCAQCLSLFRYLWREWQITEFLQKNRN